jgi:tol-pal system protein YbgF
VQLDNLSSFTEMPVESSTIDYNKFYQHLAELRDDLDNLAKNQDLLEGQMKKKSQVESTASTKPKKNTTSHKPIAKSTASEDKLLYQNGRHSYETKNFSDAVQLFREFLKKYPDSKLAANSQYWLGECYYSLESFDYAKNEFQKVIDFYGESSKVPDSHVKIALIYKQEGQNQQAKLELLRVIKRHPKYERRELVECLLKELD